MILKILIVNLSIYNVYYVFLSILE